MDTYSPILQEVCKSIEEIVDMLNEAQKKAEAANKAMNKAEFIYRRDLVEDLYFLSATINEGIWHSEIILERLYEMDN